MFASVGSMQEDEDGNGLASDADAGVGTAFSGFSPLFSLYAQYGNQYEVRNHKVCATQCFTFSLSDLFLSHIRPLPFHALYSISLSPKSCARALKQFQKQESFRMFLSECEVLIKASDSDVRGSMSSFLIMPVQRIPR